MGNLINILCDADLCAGMKAYNGKALRDHVTLQKVLEIYQREQQERKEKDR